MNQPDRTERVPRLFQPSDEFRRRIQSEVRTPSSAAVNDPWAGARNLMAWAHGLWRHDGEHDPGTRDPGELLRRARQGERFRCVEFSILTAAAGTALGYPGRVVGLRTKDVETAPSGAGHVVAEIYNSSLKRWVMVDSQWALMPVVDGVPVSVAGLIQAVEEGKAVEFMGSDGRIFSNSKYLDWISPYLFYVAIRLDQSFSTESRDFDQIMFVPKGAKQPSLFQGQPMPGRIYAVHRLSDLYDFPRYTD